LADITHILSINSGSSSIKFALFAFGTGLEEQQLDGAVERIGQSVGRIWLEQAGQRVLDRQQAFADQSAALQAIVQALTERGITHPDAIGHRIVSGGPHQQAHVRIDEAVLNDLRNVLAFAPLHLPAEIAAIESLQKIWPGKTQVACLDTAFHQSMPEVAARLPLPRNLWEEGVRKYGFHGLSYEYIVSQLPDQGRAPTIIAHLGNGASMAAVVDGHCLDTTMGLTPTGGMVMGTRSGDLDPGILLYLMAEKGYTAPQLERLLNHLSGLLGISACSGDMQTLLQQREQNPHAAEAIAQFAYSARKHIGSLMAVLGSVQRLIFTGGIGEHAAAVRWAICRPLEALGFRLDPVANSAVAQAARRISARESPIEVLVMPTDEDLMIARHTLRLLGTGSP
jgi:acetate kinase